MGHKRMLTKCWFLGAVLLLAGIIVSAGQATPTQGAIAPQHFYTVTMAVSDAGPFWFDYITDVQQQGDGVLVRDIRIAPVIAQCPRTVTVKAMQQVLPDVSVGDLAAKYDLCSIQQSDIDSAISSTWPKGMTVLNVSIEDSRLFGIVVQCGADERLLQLPSPEEIANPNVLKSSSPKIAALWDLTSDITSRAFGSGSSFYHVSQSRDREYQALGETLVPELRAGKYDLGFWKNPCWINDLHCKPHSVQSLLEKYAGVIDEPELLARMKRPELLQADSFHFLKYQAPDYPSMGLQDAVSGDVELVITTDPGTGAVKYVRAQSASEILQKWAISAAQEWRFDPSFQTSQPIHATVRFEINCPGD